MRGSGEEVGMVGGGGGRLEAWEEEGKSMARGERRGEVEWEVGGDDGFGLGCGLLEHNVGATVTTWWKEPLVWL